MWASRHKNIRRRFAVTQLSKNRLEKRNQVARSKLLFLPIELLDLSRTKPKKLTAPRACGQADIKISDGIFCRNFCRCSLSYLSIAVQSPYFDRANGVRTSRKIADSCFAVGNFSVLAVLSMLFRDEFARRACRVNTLCGLSRTPTRLNA